MIKLRTLMGQLRTQTINEATSTIKGVEFVITPTNNKNGAAFTFVPKNTVNLDKANLIGKSNLSNLIIESIEKAWPDLKECFYYNEEGYGYIVIQLDTTKFLDIIVGQIK